MANPNDIDADYGRWKTLVPFLYDWFAHHRLMWPSLSCRWGAVLETNEFKHKQRLYLSEQTDGSAQYPNTLVVTNVEVVKRRVAAAEHLTFEEESRSPFVKSWKKIIHPGEVNKIREFESRPGLVVTHTDAPELFVWDTETQPHRKTGPAAASDRREENQTPSKPDLVLTGHAENAEFALAVRGDAFDVASGGKDRNVLLWNVLDHDGGGALGGGPPLIGGSPSLGPRHVFEGHADTVEDVAFHPGSSGRELCSVACDRALLFWDVRAGSKPAHAVLQAHADDLHTVDWSSLDDHFVVTGSADSTVKLWDKRKLTATGDACVVHTFSLHSAGITTVQWCPDQKGVFASGAEDGYLNVWDITKIGKSGRTPEEAKNAPPEIMFQHAGHRTQVSDFQWNPLDPMTIASVSSGDGGNTLQMWRMNDLIYRPENEALAELEKHKAVICGAKIVTGAGETPKNDQEQGGVNNQAERGVPNETQAATPMVE
jgi:histone-binding protein RBBP4|tara:strand:+ start:2348 stop:3802 length:1455 start_codon:yes stop_codon:yes gene_type:complete